MDISILMLFAFKYLGSSLFGAPGLGIRKEKIERKEAEAAAFSEILGNGKPEEVATFEELERNAKVDTELERLMAEMGMLPAAAPADSELTALAAAAGVDIPAAAPAAPAEIPAADTPNPGI